MRRTDQSKFCMGAVTAPGAALKKIGLFGGTFNPIHFGHLRAAEEVRQIFELHQVIFIPASYPPHKKKVDGRASSRLEMVRLAIQGNPSFSVSDVELQRPGKSYSVETIRFFRQKFGLKASLFFIVGLDAFLEIHTWKDYAALFELSHFVVMSRPGLEKKFSPEHLPVELAQDFCYDDRKRGYAYRSGFCVFPREITALDISSTEIRKSFREGRSVRYLLPFSVEDYIRSCKIYRQKEAEAEV
jgi:nicotinate-nucleotide adenylyltransferase